MLGAIVLAAVVTTTTAQGLCVVEHCSKQLLECQLDSVCREWSNCNTGCGMGPKSLPCQIRCADLYKPTDATADKINLFSECVISLHHCVPQMRQHCPTPSNTLKRLDLAELGGEWFITRGWNPMFDCFDCQHHNFTLGASSEAKPLHGDLKYRVKMDLECTYPNCTYLQREVFQSFAQPDPAVQGHLTNHNNSLAELHYSDDWFVLAAKADTFALVYYCGCNDATCGYSGSVLYTRSASYNDLDAGDKAAIAAAVSGAQVADFEFATMCYPDNRACA